MKVDRPKPNTFLVRGLQWTTIIERMFNADSAESREAWINAIKVSQNSAKAIVRRMWKWSTHELFISFHSPPHSIFSDHLYELGAGGGGGFK
ncbi:unnamed protein product [Toxocara canis]|uniref:PH domain-containing protein n=1 Tax=Toxocara canis TaxID=6265 RepID=A0A183U892_TOXCA|nr:unnamed protein product [Toxocara canis]